MNLDQPSSARQAALLLHAMSVEDCEWVLASMSDSHRQSLQKLLVELKELGIPADSDLLKQALKGCSVSKLQKTKIKAASTTEMATAQESAVGFLSHLSEVELLHLVEILRNEPPGLIVYLLSVRNWPWHDALLNQLGAVRRRFVQDALDQAMGAEVFSNDRNMLKEVLLERLVQRLVSRINLTVPKQQSEVSAKNGAQRFFQRMFKRVGNQRL